MQTNRHSCSSRLRGVAAAAAILALMGLWPHVDAAAFVDAGNVAARIEDLDLARTSAGLGLRVHTTRTTLVRFDVGHSREAWRFILKLTDAIRLGRLARRTAALPFVP